MTEPGRSLLGREIELDLLEGWLDEAADGRGRLVWIEGEPGIGKSSVAAATLDRAADRGFLVLSSSAAELAGGRPFEIIAEALGVTPDPGDERRQKVAGILAADPESADTGLPPTLDGGEREQWLIEQLFTIVEDDCAKQPVLILLEDVHWADPSSLGFLARLVRSAPDLPLMVLATVRSGPRSERLDQLRSGSAEAGAEVLTPRPLDEAAVIDLVRLRTGETPGPSLLAQLGRCAGNPLFATELIDALVAEGAIEAGSDGLGVSTDRDLPESLAATIVNRVRLLGEGPRTLLELATVIGQSFTIIDLSILAGRPSGALWPDLRTAIDSGFVVESGDRLAFRHAVVREALYANLPEATRAALHLDLARALAAGNAPAGRVAEHFARGAQTGDRDAVAWLGRAAREAAFRGPEVAVGLLSTALEIADPADPARGRLIAELAFDLLAAGRREEGEALCRQALEEAAYPMAEGALRLCLTESLMIRGELAEALAQAQKAVSSPELTEAERAHAMAWLAIGPLHAGDFATALELGEKARSLGEQTGSVAPQVKGLVTSGMAAGMTGELERQEEALREATLLTERSPTRANHANQPHVLHAMALACLDRFDEAREQIAHAARAYERLGMQSQLPYVHLLSGFVLFQMDRWGDALVEFESSVTRGEQSGAGWFLDGLGGRAVIHARRAELEQAEELLAEMERARAGGASEFAGYWEPWARALIAESRGDLPGAIEGVFGFWQGRVAAGLSYDAYLLSADLARMLAAAGNETGRLGAVAAATEELAARNPEPKTLQLAARRLRALHDGNVTELVAIADASRDSARAYEAVVSAETAASALLAAGRTEEAEAWGREGIDAAEALGAERDAARIRATLREGGIRLASRGPNRRTKHGWESLTPSEARIADLVSEGLSNPQIAERLVISKRTVSTHVSSILRKLELTSRVQLAAQAAARNTTNS